MITVLKMELVYNKAAGKNINRNSHNKNEWN